MMKAPALILCSLFFAGCVAAPQGVDVVKTFDLDRYLGTWYEIARLDHSFERNLNNVSADYIKRKDGGIDVLNRGFNPNTKVWKEAKGRAYPVGETGFASLKVTFFWPFYAGYNIIDLDQAHYRYALVCGPNRDYLWILAREKKLEETIVKRLVAKAKALGFQTEALIFVEQEGGRS